MFVNLRKRRTKWKKFFVDGDDVFDDGMMTHFKTVNDNFDDVADDRS